jgi:hypothetical protein
MNKLPDNKDIDQKNWFSLFDGRHNILLAVAPPLLLSIGSSSAILSNHLLGAIAVWGSIAIVIFTGGIITLFKGMPVWGDTWLGTFLIFIALIIRLFIEECKWGGSLVSFSFMTSVTTVFICLMLLCLILFVALKSWRRAGLLGIGLSITLSIGIWNTFARPPFSQGNLALFAAPIGLLTAACIYLYLRKSDKIRIIVLTIVWVTSLSTPLVSSYVYQEWFHMRGKVFPLISLMSILSILLWCGPIMAWTISIVRKMATGLFINSSE